jgi:hypothetical protein
LPQTLHHGWDLSTPQEQDPRPPRQESTLAHGHGTHCASPSRGRNDGVSVPAEALMTPLCLRPTGCCPSAWCPHQVKAKASQHRPSPCCPSSRKPAVTLSRESMANTRTMDFQRANVSSTVPGRLDINPKATNYVQPAAVPAAGCETTLRAPARPSASTFRPTPTKVPRCRKGAFSIARCITAKPENRNNST